MATKTKWFFFWLISGSFLAGILAVCFVVSAVNWLGSETPEFDSYFWAKDRPDLSLSQKIFTVNVA